MSRPPETRRRPDCVAVGSLPRRRPQRRRPWLAWSPNPRGRGRRPAWRTSASNIVESAFSYRNSFRPADHDEDLSMADHDQELDACGLNCPLPILRAKKALSKMARRRDSAHHRDRPGVGEGLRSILPPDRERAAGIDGGRREVLLPAEKGLVMARSSSSCGDDSFRWPESPIGLHDLSHHHARRPHGHPRPARRRRSGVTGLAGVRRTVRAARSSRMWKAGAGSTGRIGPSTA